MHPRDKTIISWVILGIGLVLSIIALSTSQWSRFGSSASTGLFKTCVAGTCASNDGTALSAKLQTARAFGIMLTVSLLLAIVLCGLSHLDEAKPQTAKLLHGMAVFFAWWAVVSGVITLSSFAAHVKTTGVFVLRQSYGYGFALEIVATVLATVGAVLLTVR